MLILVFVVTDKTVKRDLKPCDLIHPQFTLSCVLTRLFIFFSHLPAVHDRYIQSLIYTHVQKKGNTFQKSTKTLPLLLQIGNLT